MTPWELAQVNVATPSAPLTSPELAWFTDALEAVNAVADVAVLCQCRRSFPRMAEAHQALWWVPAGYRPTVADAEERLGRLRDLGPTPFVFTFRQPFPAPDAVAAVETDTDWMCPA